MHFRRQGHQNPDPSQLLHIQGQALPANLHQFLGVSLQGLHCTHRLLQTPPHHLLVNPRLHPGHLLPQAYLLHPFTFPCFNC